MGVRTQDQDLWWSRTLNSGAHWPASGLAQMACNSPDLVPSQDLKPVIDGMDGIKISQGLGLQDFDLIRVIGRGSYAKVLLVRLKKNDQVYAMKVVKKELVHDDEVGPGPWLAPAFWLLALFYLFTYFILFFITVLLIYNVIKVPHEQLCGCNIHPY